MSISKDFSKGSVSKNILKLAVPMTLAQLINILYNIVDRMYIGRIPNASSLALTGVGITFPIITIIMAFANLYGMGGAPLCSIERGKGNNEKAEEIMGNSFTLLLITGLMLTIVILIFKKPLLYLLGASDNTFSYANDYITIYLLGSVFVMISLGMNSFINSQGFGRIGMMTILVGAITNIILDPLLIFGVGFIPPLGVVGAALATVCAQVVVTLIFILAYIKNHYVTGRKAIKYLDKKVMLNITKLGMPACLENGLFTIFSMVIGRIIAQWGATAIAVQKVGSQIEAISWMTAGLQLLLQHLLDKITVQKSLKE